MKNTLFHLSERTGQACLSAITVCALFFLTTFSTSCVVSSSKYKQLQAQLDSLQGDYGVQKNQMDEVFSILNEVEEGLGDIRRTENILAIESSKEGTGITENQRVKMMSDVYAVKDAINRYKEKIEELKKESNIKSVEFKKRLNAIQKELDEKSAAIESLRKLIQEKDAIISKNKVKIDSLDRHVSNLKEDLAAIAGENEQIKETIASQDRALYEAYYIIGSKDELIESGVLSKGGLFKPAKVSYNAEKTSFIKIDYREISTINTNASKAKVLSNHRKGTYSIVNVDGEAIINISDPTGFWEQTKYLVIQTR